jgi:hypothetical protein
MGYALIWTEALVAALLFVALLTALLARWRLRFLAGFLSVLAVVLLLTCAGGVTYVAGYLYFNGYSETNWFAYTLSWTLMFLLGSAELVRRGRRSGGEGAGPAARAWSRGWLALACGMMLIVLSITFTNMDLAVKVQLTSLRTEAGAKMVSMQPPPIPDRENAALVYQEAIAASLYRDSFPQPLIAKTGDWFDLTRPDLDLKDKDVQEFLDRQERSLALFRQAAAMPKCWFNRDYFQSIEMLLPEPHQLKYAANLLSLDARVKAARGEGPAALDDLAAIFAIADQIDDPIFIALLVSAAIERIGVKTLEIVLPQIKWRAEDLVKVSLKDNVSFQRKLHRACQMEEASSGLLVFLSPSMAGELLSDDMSNIRLLGKVFDSAFYRVFLLPDDLAAYRRIMKGYQRLTGWPFYQAAPYFDERRKDVRGGILTALVVPAVRNLAEAAADTDASRQLARIAVAAASYRLKNGKYPDRIDDLAPKFLPSVPLDPFDGQPLRLKRDGDELVLYSIGRDLKDDGGVERTGTSGKGDIVFRLK